MLPDDLRYTAEHEWVRHEADGTVTFGVTDYAQSALGDIVYVALPGVGSRLTAGAACGEIESTKSVSDIYAPVTGEVIEINSALDSAPELVNQAPYATGWMARIRLDGPQDESLLLNAAAYGALIGE